jgi:hypothetical protein
MAVEGVVRGVTRGRDDYRGCSGRDGKSIKDASSAAVCEDGTGTEWVVRVVESTAKEIEIEMCFRGDRGEDLSFPRCP